MQEFGQRSGAHCESRGAAGLLSRTVLRQSAVLGSKKQSLSRSEAQLVRDRQAFRELMAWRSDMLPVYDQAIRRHDLPRTAARIHAWIDRRGRRPIARKEGGPGTREAVPLGPASSEAAAMLEEMLGGRGKP